MDLDLFAGAGGLALGLEAAGFSPTKYYENDASACETLRHNLNSRSPTLTGQVTEGDVTLTDWPSQGPQVRLLAAGAPCQPFSLAGNHLGQADPRNLFPHVMEAIRALQPEAVLIENVRGLQRESMRRYFDYLLRQMEYPSVAPRVNESWIDHRRRLEQHRSSPQGVPSYSVGWALLNAADYGVPQIRHRLFMVAVRAGLPEYSFPPPTHSKAALEADKASGEYWTRYNLSPESRPEGPLLDDASRLRPWGTVRDALVGLPEPYPHEEPLANNHWSISGARAYKGHTGSPPDWPSKTIKAGVHGVPGGENMMVCEDGSVRYYTLREMARLQTFPDDHYFCGARSSVTRQIGNAVPCALAAAVARPLRTLLDRREANGGPTVGPTEPHHGASEIRLDPLTAEARSVLMSKVRSRDNRSTELKAVDTLKQRGITGWTLHPDGIQGNPDLYFPDRRLAVFIDGCFWHACPKCGRLPKTRVDFWKNKIEGNRRRDRKVTRALRNDGYRVMRVWEHRLRDGRWIAQLKRQLREAPP